MGLPSDPNPAAQQSSEQLLPARSVATENVAQAASEQPRMLFNPPTDIYETPDGLVLYADLPGVNLEGLNLQVQDNKLTLFGRIQVLDSDPVRVVHQEYPIGDFLRSFILSDEVDHERIQAKLSNGVLRVELPRAPRSKPRRIEVAPG